MPPAARGYRPLTLSGGNRSACDARKARNLAQRSRLRRPLGRIPPDPLRAIENERFQTALRRFGTVRFRSPRIVKPHFRNRLSFSMQQSPSFQRIGYDNHRKIRNRDSIKTKVLGEEGVGASRAGSFWGGGEPWGAPLPNLKIALLPLSTHSAASWRRRGRGSASYREERFPARRRCRTWDDR